MRVGSITWSFYPWVPSIRPHICCERERDIENQWQTENGPIYRDWMEKWWTHSCAADSSRLKRWSDQWMWSKAAPQHKWCSLPALQTKRPGAPAGLRWRVRADVMWRSVPPSWQQKEPQTIRADVCMRREQNDPELRSSCSLVSRSGSVSEAVVFD